MATEAAARPPPLGEWLAALGAAEAEPTLRAQEFDSVQGLLQARTHPIG
eukprot:COSAG04_NODE_1295_length_7328_cov_9.809241_9_plen_49_part_00